MDIVEKYLCAWNSHDVEAIRQCFHAEGVYIDSNLNEEVSAEQFSQRAGELFTCFPELKITLIERTGSLEQGLMASRWALSGALPGQSLYGVDMLCIKEGLLQSVQVYFDYATGRTFAKVPSLHLKYQPKASNTKSIEKYRTSGLSNNEAVEIHTKLEMLMAESQPFLQPDLSLSMLASALDISTNHLSQVVNSMCGCNFYQYVNRYRIAFSQQLIEADKSQTLTSLVIALDSGFQSTSTFYAAFKKETGMSPSAYRQQLTSAC